VTGVELLRAQRDALLELCRALDDIAANEGLGCPDLEARCAELGLDTRCWWRREREEGNG